MENWNDFEKDAAVYFERLHQVFAKCKVRFTDSGKAEWAVNCYSHKIQQWTEVCVRPVLGIRPAVCIASVCLHTAGRMHRISLRMHTAGRMHSIGHIDIANFDIDNTNIDIGKGDINSPLIPTLTLSLSSILSVCTACIYTLLKIWN